MSPVTEEPVLDIRLLGPPVVLVRGRPLEVDTRKAVAVLALLATDRRAFARDELAALLWPEADDAGARGALRRTLSTLRAAVGEGALHVDRARVALVDGAVRSDIADLDRLTGLGSVTDLRTVAELARGPFLAGFSLRDSPDFDDWRAARAVTVERTVLGALDRLGAALAADGDLEGAIRATSSRLDLDPLDEAAHVRLMELLDASGDRSAALRQYRACVAILDRELGVEPLAATTARYEAIRDRVEAAPDVARPAAAPTPAAAGPLPLVGREEPLARAREALAGPSATSGGRVVAIRGEAGIGKTRLAQAALAELGAGGGTVLAATAFPAERSIAYGLVVDLLRDALAQPAAAARLAALAPATRAELARLLPAVDPDARAEPATPSPGAHARLVAAVIDGLVAAAGGGAPGAIWVDDVHWLDDASREVLDVLLRRLGSLPVSLVVTWRPEDLDGAAEAFVGRVLAAPGAVDLALGRLDEAAVVGLVRAAAGEGPGARRDAAFAADLHVASEGLPLYVVEVLAEPDRSDPATLPLGVGAVLRARLAAVDETTGQVLAAASVIGRSFDLASLRHASGRSEDEVVDATDAALRRGLVRETGDGLDFVHGALRDLAYEGTSLTRRRLLHRRVAEALRLDLAGSGRDDLARLALVATHERAAGRDAEAAEAHRAAGDRAAAVYANAAALEQYEAALALRTDDPAALHEAIGRLRTRTGDYTGAVAALESAAAVANPGDLPRLEWSLARAHLRRGDLAAARHHLEAAAAGAAEAGDAALEARVAVDRSVLARRAGDHRAAGEAARAAVGLAEAARDDVTQGAARRMLGLAALDAGDAEGAVAQLRLALPASREDPDPSAAVAALVGLAMAEGAAGDLDTALAHGEEALGACRRIGDRHLEAAVENHLADLLHVAGRDDEALEHLRRAVAAFAELGGDPADPDPGIWMLSAS